MSFVQEFKAFAVKGNMVDMAVAVVLGTAFGKIVSSLLNEMIMPLIGMFLGGKDFSNLFIALDGSDFDTLAAARESGAAVLGYGVFIQTTLNFFIIAFIVFLMIKLMNNVTTKIAADAAEEEEQKAAPEPKEDVLLLREIRDSLVVSVAKLELTHGAIEAVGNKFPELPVEPEVVEEPEPEPEPETGDESADEETAAESAEESGAGGGDAASGADEKS